MPYFKATIEVLIEATSEAEACDAVAESLRGILREFEPSSSFIDWRYVSPESEPTPHSGVGFEYA